MEDKILVERSPECTLLSLPTELLIVILEYVFHNNQQRDGFTNHDLPGDVTIDRQYSANHCLRPLLTCRRLYEDGSLLALSKTNFVVSNPFFKIPDRLALLHSKQVAAIRNIAFVANARHFRDLVEWRQYPFDMADLQLETLTVVLQATNFWHYLTDFNAGIARLLRNLQGVKRFVVVRNNGLVKGSLHTWYNRLVGLIMKMDRLERYGRATPNPEKVWWRWNFDAVAQRATFEACPPKLLENEVTYMQKMEPLMEELKLSEEREEWNPDPRSRNHYY